MKLTDIRFRHELPRFLNEAGLVNFGAEIGVQRGEFSTFLLTNWWGRRLYMIDAWRQLDNYNDCANVGPQLQHEHMSEAFRNTYVFGDRTIMIRDTSIRASELFMPNSLDFVFVDADHSYRGVSEDLAHWYPKVRSGGLLCGHDYANSSLENNGHTDFGVKCAVDEFADSIKAQLHTTIEMYMNDKTNTPFGSWFIIK